MDKNKIIKELESSLDNTKTIEKEIRLHYLLAKFYSIEEDSSAIFHFLESQNLLEYAGENGLMGFRNFYKYREKLEVLESSVHRLMFSD